MAKELIFDCWGISAEIRSTSWRFIWYLIFLYVTFVRVHFQPYSFTAFDIMKKKYVIDFVVKDFPSWKCICSRPICVEAITAERGNKSVPNEKLPESGQLPPDLQDLPQVTNLFHCSAQELGGGRGAIF